MLRSYLWLEFLRLIISILTMLGKDPVAFDCFMVAALGVFKSLVSIINLSFFRDRAGSTSTTSVIECHLPLKLNDPISQLLVLGDLLHEFGVQGIVVLKNSEDHILMDLDFLILCLLHFRLVI